MRYDGIVFDLDGTLLDTLGDIVASANSVLVEMGCELHSRELYREYIGHGLQRFAERALPEDRRTNAAVEFFVSRYRDVYAIRWCETSKPFEGVPELLSELARNRLPIAVLSNKRHDFTELCVRTLLGRWTFELVRGEMTGVPLKPDPTAALAVATTLGIEPSRCLFVGDSDVDLETAQRAGMPSAGVLWGYRDREVLEQYKTAILVSQPLQLLKHILES
jgi:phosphoglycolate phosphatase